MYPYIETILLKDGALMNMKHHQERFERTRREALGLGHHPQLEEIISIPELMGKGAFKCRLLYGEETSEPLFQAYERPLIRSLQLVFDDHIEYSHKGSNRSQLTALYRQRGDCDDILIVKNGLITDSYMANVAFREGRQWLTPDAPLLPGCMRAQLLEEGRISEARILPSDLERFSRVRLINALNDMDEGIELPIRALKT